FVLRAFRDAGGNRLRWPLHRFGRHFQTGHNLHLLPSVIEGSILAYCGLHAAHTRRAVAVFDVELVINGALAVVTVRAQIPGARQFHLAQSSEKVLRAQFAIARLLAARTGNGLLFSSRLRELQQLCKSGCSGLAPSSRRGEALGNTFVIHHVGQSRMWAMTGIVGTVTMATRITAATTGSGNRPGAKIF